ncbi:RrF2 family transcriptional regulator [Salininema proteolyticum]|uniref:RrF2 family transcriptional regulator n=1 Tax=Salininema proteolyticum TaxID=1607685 RepID=A0ABV8TWJ2_9ACTN
MRLSARLDYALRAAAVLAARGPRWTTAEEIATDQDIPRKFLESILSQLRKGAIIESKRGAEGGHRLARPAADTSLADVIRCIDGPLLGVRGQRPEEVRYEGSAAALADVLVALRAAERSILERVSLADVAARTLPAEVAALIEDPDAWKVREIHG